ncbi:hypothetical protein HYDPIDRAFT_186703 [Hydnomerulius pinastri MD-312]|nr:hypothetical protein HYDPIDRAFT_186703 [Hydnomerulius pinastri MD-312]
MPTDDNLRQRLLCAESDLLNALTNGERSLSSYEASWLSLQEEISQASLRHEICGDTSSLAHAVASRVLSIATCFLDIEQKQEEWSSQLHNDWDIIIKNLNTINLSSNASPVPHNDTLSTHSSSRDSNSSSSHESTGGLPPYIAGAYHWLLENLHNPYPSSEVKDALAKASASSLSSINSWFINTRRRMGWTALCRDSFRNSRTDASDAAYRALVKEDPSRPLAPELIHAFMVMKVSAEGLYSSAFIKSALAGDLDAVVKDMTDEDKKFVEDQKRREAEEAKRLKECEKEMRRKQGALEKDIAKKSMVQDCYPSPERSRTSSPVPTLDESLTDEESEDEDVLPPVVAGRKRRSSSVELVDRASLVMVTRPMKRLRSSASTESCLAFEACLPSPPSSANGAGESSDYDSPTFPSHTPSPAPPTDNHTVSTASRKRRLSEADASGLPKRPRGSMGVPRLHAVSDPLPRSSVESEYSIDEWFNINFDALFALPPPVDSAEPDHSAPWEVELFSDYCIPQDLRRTSKSPSPHTPEYQTSATTLPTNLAELDSLLQSFGDNALVASAQTPEESSTSFMAPYTHSSSLDFPLPSDLTIDWTALLNNSETLAPMVDTIFPQSYPSESQPLPEIDLSMLQLPQLLPTSNTQSTLSADFASKQAKLLQYQAMQEAMKKMELQLQSEGLAV